MGTVVPILPGPFLVAGAVAVWGVALDQPVGWALAVGSLLLIGLATGAKYLIPARWMRDGGVPTWILAVGAVVGVVGFFVVPVVGLVLGFIAGVFVAELARLRSASQAWPTTVVAMKAAGLSMLIDLAAVMLIVATWVTLLLAGYHPL